MARYIDADALKQRISLHSTIQRVIDSIPAADVRPERYSEWVDGTSPDCAVCSNCKERFYSYDNEIIRFRYCPNCGAMMDGKDGDGSGNHTDNAQSGK